MATYTPSEELKEKIEQLFDSDSKVDQILWELVSVYFKIKIPELKVVSIGLETDEEGKQIIINVYVVNTLSIERLSVILAVLDLINLSSSNNWMPFTYSFEEIETIQEENSDSINAGYRIDHCVTQEGQLFYDTDVFTADFKDFYPFDFKNELLYAKNVTFHNNDCIQWDQNCLRKNDVVFAASKRLKRSCETVEIKAELERIIESIFKVAYINKKLNLLLWPIGCGVFKNDQRIIPELFAKSIKANIGYFKEMVMVICDPTRADKRFNDYFIAELNKRQLCYRIN